MYKVGAIVKYKCPDKFESKGKIISKYKILEDVRENVVGKIVYTINYDNRCCLDHVFEEDIINGRIK